MIFVGDLFEFEFTTKTDHPIRCALGKQFYMLLFSDYSAIYEETTHHVCFVVPIHYLSFIKSISSTISKLNSVDKLFDFKNRNDSKRMAAYVQGLPDDGFEIIKDLKGISKNRR